MNATLTHKDDTCQYAFNIVHEDNTYNVIVYTNSKGKFIDDYVSSNGEELGYEGTEGQIREDIMTFIDENWDKLV